MRARGSISVTLVSIVAIAAACSNATPDTVVLQASGGLDGAAFAGDPPVARVELHVRPQGGSETTVASVDATTTNGIDVPSSVSSDGIGALVLVGLDASGARIAYGRTPDLDLAGIDQNAVQISILVQRVGAVRRAMNLPTATSGRPMVVPYGPRFVLVADPANGALQRIDLLTTSAASESLVFSSPPATLASSGDALLAIDATGAASLLHPGDSTPSTPSAPDGTTFADVAGAVAIVGDDEATYLVGGTRATPTDLVIRLASDGSIAARHMTVARSGGAAAWVPGNGLFLVGGAEPDGSAPPVELLGTSSGAHALAFPVDGTKGAILASDGGSKVVRVATSGVVDLFDLSCAAPPCSPAVQTARLSGDARVDDAITHREGGGFVVVRGGAIALLDDKLSTVTPLGAAGDSVGVALLPTGATGIVSAGDVVVRTVY